MKTHVLIIRFHYDEGDPRFLYRFGYFVGMVWPRICAQTDQNFDVAVRCNPWQDRYFRELSPRIKVFRVKNEAARYRGGKTDRRFFEDHAPWDDVEGLAQYDIQSGLDSDDLIAPDYMAIIKKNVHANEGASLHLCFQPEIFNMRSLRFEFLKEYSPTCGSAFLTLYQPDKSDYKFIYCRSHISLWREASKSIVIPKGHCWASVHWMQESTGK